MPERAWISVLAREATPQATHSTEAERHPPPPVSHHGTGLRYWSPSLRAVAKPPLSRMAPPLEMAPDCDFGHPDARESQSSALNGRCELGKHLHLCAKHQKTGRFMHENRNPVPLLRLPSPCASHRQATRPGYSGPATTPPDTVRRASGQIVFRGCAAEPHYGAPPLRQRSACRPRIPAGSSSR